MAWTGVRARSTRRSIVAAIALTIVAGWQIGVFAEAPTGYRIADLKVLQSAFVELADTVRPSVVAIRTYQVHSPASPGTSPVMRPYSQGSGFIIDSDGYIVTNRHVVVDSNVVSVILHNGLKFDARIVQTDVRSDLAVLKIDAENLKAVKFGDLADVKVNQWAFVCGNPFGLANEDGRTSVTYGVVSALGRQMTQQLVGDSNVEYYGNMIETSATINPGNSGGPLFDLDGKVIGVVAAIETSSGVSEGFGFSIPIDKNTRRVLDTLKAGNTVRYGFIGVMIQDVDPPQSSLVVDSRVHRGAELTGLNPTNSPAAKAGLKAKDLLIEYDGVPIEDSDHLVRLVGATPVGRQVPITFLRRGVKRTTTITLGDRYEMLSQGGRKPE